MNSPAGRRDMVRLDNLNMDLVNETEYYAIYYVERHDLSAQSDISSSPLDS